jgi:hypothetical protein
MASPQSTLSLTSPSSAGTRGALGCTAMRTSGGRPTPARSSGTRFSTAQTDRQTDRQIGGQSTPVRCAPISVGRARGQAGGHLLVLWTDRRTYRRTEIEVDGVGFGASGCPRDVLGFMAVCCQNLGFRVYGYMPLWYLYMCTNAFPFEVSESGVKACLQKRLKTLNPKPWAIAACVE